MKKQIPEEIKEASTPPEEHPVLCQFGVTFEELKIWIIERPFFLEVEDGPLQRMEPGTLVRLGPRFAQEMFLIGKVSPVEVGETFEARRDFRTVENGKYPHIKRGDILKLSRDEALTLLRRGEVRERKGEMK